jgi:probable F420-dependent oxidoreductase
MSSGLALEQETRLGLMFPGGDGRSALALARRCEALGFDSLFVGDHLAFHVPVPDSLSLLAFLAAATERITLGTGVYLLPLRPPFVAAKAAATVDLLSGGRLVFGVGVGGEFPPEFDAAGVPLRERGARTDEAVALLRRLWREDAVRHQGRFFRLGPVTLEPKPARPGGPPIWVGGRSPAAMRRAGRLGDGYVSTMTSVERYRANLEEILRHAEASGRAERPFATAALLFTVLDADRERAAARAAEVLGRVYARDFREAARKYCLLGRPEDCLEQMRAYAGAGVRHFLLSPLADPAGFVEQVGAGIVPEIRGLLR